MPNYSRREFLTMTALGLGVAVSGSPIRSLMSSTDRTPLPQTVFWKGNVLDISNGKLTIQGRAILFDGTMQIDLYGGNEVELAIHLDEDTTVWKGGEVTLAAIKKGDLVYGRGLVLSNGDFLAGRMWVNIAQVRGKVTQVGREMATLEQKVGDNQAIVTVTYDDKTVINDGIGNHKDIRAAKHMQALGVILESGWLKATRIWI